MSTAKDREKRIDREKNGNGMEDERRWKESEWENGPYNWCSSWKAAKNKGGRGRTARRETPDEVGISFANQNSCRQVRKREEFDEAFSTLS